jgi:poly(A) polymerase
VESLEDAGLYEYLQAEASARLKTDAGFRRRYFQTLSGLGLYNEKDDAEKEAGRVLAALIQDYLAGDCSWETLEKGGWEEYKSVFFAARRFIFPMNPPRMELEKAVRLVFADHGVELKKMRIFDERRKGGRVHSDKTRFGVTPAHHAKAAPKPEHSPAGENDKGRPKDSGRRKPRPKG